MDIRKALAPLVLWLALVLVLNLVIQGFVYNNAGGYHLKARVDSGEELPKLVEEHQTLTLTEIDCRQDDGCTVTLTQEDGNMLILGVPHFERFGGYSILPYSCTVFGEETKDCDFRLVILGVDRRELLVGYREYTGVIPEVARTPLGLGAGLLRFLDFVLWAFWNTANQFQLAVN